MENVNYIKYIVSNKIISVSKLHNLFTNIIEDIDDEYEYETLKLIKDSIKKCFSPNFIFNFKKCVGSKDDYHNLSVILARKELYLSSCTVLEKGLDKFPNSVDLLADYIEYGIRCEKIKECKKYYKHLNSIPKDMWTWRAFDFSIDYLLFILESNPQKLDHREIRNLIDTYKTNFNYDEKSYIAEANYYSKINNHKKEIETLKDAINKIKVCPRCSLKLAEIYFKQANYFEASNVLENCKLLTPHYHNSEEIGNIYLLSALCGISLYYLKVSSNSINKTMAEQVFKDYKAAELTSVRTSKTFRNLETLIDIFSENVGIDYE